MCLFSVPDVMGEKVTLIEVKIRMKLLGMSVVVDLFKDTVRAWTHPARTASRQSTIHTGVNIHRHRKRRETYLHGWINPQR